MTTDASSTKFVPPPWVTKPKLENCGLKVVKDDKKLDIINKIASEPFILFGRNASMSDIKLDHPSISRRHSLVGHGSSGNIYVMDLGSSHGTFVNGERLQKNHRQVLRDGNIIKFGASTREYVVILDLDGDHGNEEQLHRTVQNSNDRKRKMSQMSDTKSNGEHEATPSKRAKIDKVSCRHILVKHAESRRARSWKSDSITRSKQDAMDMLEEYRKQISNAEDLSARFIQVAEKESDCNSYKRGGDLGSFGRGRMQKPFEVSAFALDVDQLSEPVDTDSGVHLILRYA